MKGRLLHNLSANTLQLVINQLFGVLMFYVLSVNLDKGSFGLINLAITIVFTAFNILSFGIDQTVVKKIANGDDARNVLSIYIFHVLVTGLLFYTILCLSGFFFTQNSILYKLMLFIGAGKLMIFFSSPLKQVTTGMEYFKTLACMLVASNVVRGVALLILGYAQLLTINQVMWVFAAGDTLELLVTIYLFKRYIGVSFLPRWNKLEYVNLVRQSLPQVGVVLITSALARFDWLFIGFMVSAVKLAEYSFAYKVYEISTLPLLAIAPLLIPRFTQLFKREAYNVDVLRLIVRTEMIVAAFTALLLNMCWRLAVDPLTQGKYGAVNVNTVFILSFCLPCIYIMNFFWTIYFVQGQLKMILNVFIITFFVNVTGDLILIPFFKNEGAAIAFLASCLVQCVLFVSKNEIKGLNHTYISFLKCSLCAFIAGAASQYLFQNRWMALSISCVSYFLLLWAAGEFRFSDFKRIIKIMN